MIWIYFSSCSYSFSPPLSPLSLRCAHTRVHTTFVVYRTIFSCLSYSIALSLHDSIFLLRDIFILVIGAFWHLIAREEPSRHFSGRMGSFALFCGCFYTHALG